MFGYRVHIWAGIVSKPAFGIYRGFDVRKLDVLVDFSLVFNDPRAPTLATIGHASEDDLRYLQTRLP